MNLASMRDVDHNDPIGGLGPRVTPAPTPAPAPVKRDDGFIQHPDGTLSTDLPDPTAPAPILCKCGLTPAACAMTSCTPSDADPPAPAPVWPFPQRACVTPETVALRVGDRVRLLRPYFWFGAGVERLVSEICDDGTFRIEPLTEVAGAWLGNAEEGTLWTRT